MNANSKAIIQKNWKQVKLGDIAIVKNGKSNTQDALMEGNYIFFDRSTLTKRSNKFLFDTEAVILPGEGKEFIPKYYHGKFDLHQRAYAISPTDTVNGKFLYYFLDYNKDSFLKTSVGSTVRSLRLPYIQDVEVFLPPLPEQQKISEILGAVDEEIEKVSEEIEKSEEMKRGLMQRFFKEKKNSTKLGYVCDFTTGKLNSNAATKNGEYPFFTCSQEIYRIDQYSFDQEAILLAGNNAAGIYSVKHYVGKFDAYQRTYVITVKDLKNLDYEYLKQALQAKLILLKKESFGSSTKFLTLKLLQNISINLPTLQDQKKIAEILLITDKKINLTKRLKQNLTKLKKGLMQDLLSGVIPVK